MFLTNSVCGDLVTLVIAFATIFIAFFKWRYQYWKRRNVPYLEPRIPFGNIGNPFRRKETAGYATKRIYDTMKANGWKHGGIFTMANPNYMVVDLEYVKNIMAKDFQYFVNRGNYYNEKDDPLSAHLFALEGTKWRNLRIKLTPTFTSGKMKMMFQTLIECQTNLLEKIDDECRRRNAIDIKEALGCFTTDIIGSCAFGLDCNTFKDKNSPFRQYGKKVFIFRKSRFFKAIFAMIFPKIARKIGIALTPKDVSDFFMNMVKDTVEYREKNNYTRKDFLQLLIDLKNNESAKEEVYQHDGKSLTIEEIAAQCYGFFLAGFETSSTTMTFALYAMSKHQDIQDKVRDEIEKVLAKYDGKVTYEAIQEMKYMDQVINETLRMYPPVPGLSRKCVKDYKVPNHDLIIEKGTTVSISVLGIHHDKDYYPDPEKFDPERFNEENKKTRHPYAFLPFGEGPRNCIGMRFGLTESKVGLTSLLRKYKFTVSNKTQEPLKMKVNSFILAAQGEIWLNAEKI